MNKKFTMILLLGGLLQCELYSTTILFKDGQSMVIDDLEFLDLAMKSNILMPMALDTSQESVDLKNITKEAFEFIVQYKNVFPDISFSDETKLEETLEKFYTTQEYQELSKKTFNELSEIMIAARQLNIPILLQAGIALTGNKFLKTSQDFVQYKNAFARISAAEFLDKVVENSLWAYLIKVHTIQAYDPESFKKQFEHDIRTINNPRELLLIERILKKDVTKYEFTPEQTTTFSMLPASVQAILQTYMNKN